MSDYAGCKQHDNCSTSGKSARTRFLPEAIWHSSPVGMCDEGPVMGLERRGRVRWSYMSEQLAAGGLR
jgi:hypothetical protein